MKGIDAFAVILRGTVKSSRLFAARLQMASPWNNLLKGPSLTVMREVGPCQVSYTNMSEYYNIRYDFFSELSKAVFYQPNVFPGS